MSLGATLAFDREVQAQTNTSGSAKQTNSIIVSEAVGYPRVLSLDLATGQAGLFQPTVSATDSILGLSLASCNAGSLCLYRFAGILSFTGWGLTVGAYYAGTNGVITATAPSAGLVQFIGTALTSNDLQLNLGRSIRSI